MRRIILAVAACGWLLPVVGCGGASERDKNKDFDRPRTVDSKR